ncbi:MAG TPA: diguanylate cyclase [Methylibium sp.]|uniref:GGDEF domain-containing protein n=1 Tax=Methylibium sp. TaxID=2067992 RepID=UPI002DBD7D01|nr:diguanylate cyclase [Methylibium sp.]HEU4458855.1 diguanylate cyclase [Methylibium sp.]
MRLARPSIHRLLRFGVPAAAAALACTYLAFGELKPQAAWRGLDVLGEGGTALLAAAWMALVLASRPAGRVTALLALGLGCVALGAWADALDEIVSMQAAPGRFDKWIESGLPPLGMLLLTAGLVGWRREQFELSEHMAQRERLFRDHRAFDRITQLADTGYLREQLALDAARRPGTPAALLMLEIEGLPPLLHEHGRRDAVRALRAVTHQLLLNLRRSDLLCRAAGDRFVVLLPATGAAEAGRRAAHLARMVQLTAFEAGNAAWPLGLRWACVAATPADDAAALLRRLADDLQTGAVPARAAAAT